ncbi:MAG TPA: hypothetical protein VND19_16100 [Acetobacteraceae bacterium]|nr:hypothetical protein [Acetobacteraceae bacterium]
MRDPGRVKGRPMLDAVRMEAVIDAATSTSASAYTAADTAAASAYAQFQIAPVPSVSELRQSYESFRTDPSSAKGAYELAYAVRNCGNKELAAFLRNDVAPAFFHAFPAGRIVFLSTSYEFERRQGAVRGGYTLAQYGTWVPGQVPELSALADWQMLSPFIQLRTILDLGVLALYPMVPYFSATRMGFVVVFVPGELVEQKQPDFPASWLDVYRSRWDFTKGRTSTASLNVRAAGLSQPYSVHRRFLQVGGYAADDVVNWVLWLVAQSNELLLSSTDPTSFQRNGIVDFVTCFEHGLSIDRLLRKSASAQASVELAVIKYATFEVADIVDELCQYWTGSQQTERFKALFNPSQGLPRLSAALSTAPSTTRGILLDGVTSVYASLRATVLDSVFVTAKRTSTGGILVRDKTLTTERNENGDEFTANVVRALRNTHHGYMTLQDTQNRPSRYLALVTGNLPDTIAYIGVLSGLALLGDSHEMVGKPKYPIAAYA